MAVDELVTRTVGELPILRCYKWEGAWASVGYFGDVEQARVDFGTAVSVVRRWTGGGVVDHRRDFTYSLVIPSQHPLAGQGRLEVYRRIHEAVGSALRACGVEARLVTADAPVESAHCFQRPVAWDVVDADGRKLAGAGQRRTRRGFLHQGSVLAPEIADQATLFVDQLSGALAEVTRLWEPPEDLLAEARKLAREKYRSADAKASQASVPSRSAP